MASIFGTFFTSDEKKIAKAFSSLDEVGLAWLAFLIRKVQALLESENLSMSWLVRLATPFISRTNIGSAR